MDSAVQTAINFAHPPGCVIGEGAVDSGRRHRMIELAAYYRAAHRGFAGGDMLADWLAAECEIDTQLAATRASA